MYLQVWALQLLTLLVLVLLLVLLLRQRWRCHWKATAWRPRGCGSHGNCCNSGFKALDGGLEAESMLGRSG